MTDSSDTRKAAVAGQFYPAYAATLRAAVDRCLAEAVVDACPDRTEAIVVPHAGLVYSGPTAAHAYARVRGKQVRRVILLGCAHRYPLRRASVYSHGAFETPLGSLPVDTELASEISEIVESETDRAHYAEHALEVQLPFIQVVLGEVSIVPVLFGAYPSRWHAQLGARLAALLEVTDLVVASTDLSHYLEERAANVRDRESINGIMSKDVPQLLEGLESQQYSMCSAAAVVTAMAYATERRARNWQVLDYRTSAAASGDYSRVVGYAAISMERAA